MGIFRGPPDGERWVYFSAAVSSSDFGRAGDQPKKAVFWQGWGNWPRRAGLEQNFRGVWLSLLQAGGTRGFIHGKSARAVGPPAGWARRCCFVDDFSAGGCGKGPTGLTSRGNRARGGLPGPGPAGAGGGFAGAPGKKSGGPSVVGEAGRGGGRGLGRRPSPAHGMGRGQHRRADPVPGFFSSFFLFAAGAPFPVSFSFLPPPFPLPGCCLFGRRGGISMVTTTRNPRGPHTPHRPFLFCFWCSAHPQPTEGHWVGEVFPSIYVLDYGSHPEPSPSCFSTRGPGDCQAGMKPRASAGNPPAASRQYVASTGSRHEDNEDTTRKRPRSTAGNGRGIGGRRRAG